MLTGSRRSRGVKNVNVDRKVDRVITDSRANLVNDSLCTDLVNLASLAEGEATVLVDLVVGWTRERRANAGVHGSAVLSGGKEGSYPRKLVMGTATRRSVTYLDETLTSGMPEVGTVVERSSVGLSAAKHLGLPSLLVQKRNRPIIRYMRGAW